jgi:PAS domain S-box-containing protein
MSNQRVQAPTSAARVAGVYLVLGVLWILLSDRLLAALVGDPATLSLLQTVKGWAFVAASALVIAILVGREVRRLNRTESRFDALASQGIVGTFAIRSGRLVHANRRLAEIFGYDEAELLDRRLLTLVSPGDRELVRADAGDDDAGGVVRRRFTGIRKDGTTVQVEVYGRVTNWDGEPAMAGILLDISDQVRLQDRLRHAGRLEALGEATGAVAHDFNNFLTGILGNLDLVMTDIASDPGAAEESLRLVRDAATRAANLTGQLLSFSRGRTFQHRPIDVNEHIEKLSAFLRSMCEVGQTLTLELQEGLPMILLDPVALDQVVVNLFVNAKQAVGPSGTIVIRTRSRASSAGSDVFVEIVDNGSGMPDHVLEHIFEPFFTTKERGTGLGLATVRSIMDEARGHLVVDSTPGLGTTVRLLFPEAAHFLGRSRTEGPVVHGAGFSGAARIVILDADPAVGRIMAVALRRMGHRTQEATRPEELPAVLRSEGQAVDLVILDADLPQVRLGRLARDIRRTHPAVRILLTADRQLEGGMDPALLDSAVLVKPFSVDQLLASVAVALGAERAGRDTVAGA